MKTFLKSVSWWTLLLVLVRASAVAQIPVTDVANLANNTALHAESIAKWAESIAQLKTQIDQLHQQIDIQSDLRKWTGNPTEAGGKLGCERPKIAQMPGSSDPSRHNATPPIPARRRKPIWL